jgi:hypothetical protein
MQHFEHLYGTLLLDNRDIAKCVFYSGWNSAISEMMQRIEAMPLGVDTKASFNVYLKELLQLD